MHLAGGRDESSIRHINVTDRIKMDNQFGGPDRQAAIGLREPQVTPTEVISVSPMQCELVVRIIEPQQGTIGTKKRACCFDISLPPRSNPTYGALKRLALNLSWGTGLRAHVHLYHWTKTLTQCSQRFLLLAGQ
jgi:hypothetical protein